ncbi:hypothetical protein [Kitasatospora sp. NPDC001683]
MVFICRVRVPGDLDLLLELSLPGTGERVDAAVVGQDATGELTVVAVELKQWTWAVSHR